MTARVWPRQAAGLDTVSTRASAKYIPSLDGLRALSIGLVVLSHAGLEAMVPGGLGVTIFFVISGLLITWQFIVESERTGRIGIGRFYVRRIFRLIPALLVYLAVFTTVFLLMGGRTTLPQFGSALFYYANYYRIYANIDAINPFSIEWSLSVEEHYYIVYPLFIAAMATRLRQAIVPLAASIGLALAWRIYLAGQCGGLDAPYLVCGLPFGTGMAEMQRIYLGSDTRYDCILVGALVALVAHHHEAWFRRVCIGRLPFAAAGLALLLTLAIRNPIFRDTVRYTIQAFAVAILIANIVFGGQPRLARMLAWRPLVYIGRLSYSIYLYHWGIAITIYMAGGRIVPTRPEFIPYLALSFLLAALSYRFVEQPMLRYRRRLGGHPAALPN